METIKTVQDLRAVLAEEITQLRRGKTTPKELTAITGATGKILTSIKLEMEYNKSLGKFTPIAFIGSNKKGVAQ